MYNKRQPSFFQSRLGLLTVLVIVGVVLLLYTYTSDDGSLLGAKAPRGAANRPSSSGRPTRTLAQEPECDEGPVQALSWEPRVFLFKGLLSAAECARVIELGDRLGQEQGRLITATGEKTASGPAVGKFLSPELDPLLQEIDRRVADWVMIPPEHAESGYLLRYEEEQQYQPHFDYFEGEAAQRHANSGGQRVVTVVLYLSKPSPQGGGETVFPLVPLTTQPDVGDALLIHNTLPNGNLDPKTLHGSNPLARGPKYTYTKWIRERPYPHSWYLRDA